MWEDQGIKPEKRKREELQFHNLPQGIQLPSGETPAGWLPHHVHSLQRRHSRMFGKQGQRARWLLLHTNIVEGKGSIKELSGIHYKLRSSKKREPLEKI